MLVLKAREEKDFITILHGDELLTIKVLEALPNAARLLFIGPKSFRIDHSKHLEFDHTNKTYNYKPRDKTKKNQ